MDGRLERKEDELERLEIDDRIAERRRSIAERKALERQAKRQYGSNWRKVVGLVGKIKPDEEVIQTLYSVNPGLGEARRRRY